MEKISKQDLRTRRRLFAVAIFLGLSATTAQAAASQTENLYSNGSPVVELNFFDGGEFTSDYNFSKTTINAAKLGASYWKNLFDMRALNTPWQIAVTSSEWKILTGKTFSFRDAALTQENFLVQFLQDGRELIPFDVQSFAEEKISASELEKFLQEKAASEGYSALTVLTIGENLGATRESNLRGWHFNEQTILPDNEQAADFFGAVRLELARALGVEALTDDSTSALKFSDALNDRRLWTLHLTDANRNFAYAGKQIVTSKQLAALLEENPELTAGNFFVADDKVYFLGRNVTEVLDTATFDGVKGIPINAWSGADFDGVQSLIPGLMSGLPYKNYATFTELELAALQDIGYSFDRKKYFGRSIYSSGGTFSLTDDFTTSEPLAIGLHVWGANNSITQRGNISATGTGSVGIRVDGTDNKLVIPQGTQLAALDKGILVSYGREHTLDIGGEISSSNNALEFNFGSNMLGAGSEYRGSYLRYLRGLSDGKIVTARNLPLVMTDGFNYSADELNGALVDEVNLTGSLYGERAIYIGKNAFVKNINLNAGATLDGDIISDWRHFTADDGFPSDGAITPIQIQYGGKYFDAGKYIPDLTTNINFNASMNYGGNITGADNLKLHVNAGTLNFSGAADVVSVDVMRGAELFGGNFTLHDMSADLAEGFTDSETSTFINHGTIGAASPDTNLIITGNLISDGYLKKISGGEGGSIVVNGSANIEGSTVTTDSLLPNETATVLIADEITGEITNPEDKPYALSSLLNATGKIVGNTLTVTTHEANNLGSLSTKEEETLDAMNSMFDNLVEETQREEMRELYTLDAPEAKKTLSQISSTDAAQVMSVAQQSSAVDKLISNRIGRVFSTEYVDVNVRPLNFAEDDDVEIIDVPVRVKVPENNFWLNYMKNWGSLRGGTDYHGSVIVGGYDRPFGKRWRGGIFATYGTIGYGADSSRATVYDTRGGLYAGYHNRQSDVYLYANGGQLRNSLHRMLSSLGLSTNANYKSRIIEVGGEYKYDLQPRRTWHVSPFVNFQASHLRQNAYNERGAGIYNQHAEANSNTYFAAQAGLDFKRYYRTGMFGARLGVKHGFTGADPDLIIRYEGDDANSYRLRHKRDKTHFLFGLRGENEFASGWFLGGETELQISDNDRDVTASVMLRRMW